MRRIHSFIKYNELTIYLKDIQDDWTTYPKKSHYETKCKDKTVVNRSSPWHQKI